MIRYVHSILIFILLIGCKETPFFIFDDTYFNQNKISRSASSRLDGATIDSTINVRGVYGDHFFAVQKYPAILSLDKDGQYSFSLLADSLEISRGEFVSVFGIVADSILPVGISATKSIPMLKVNQLELIYATQNLIAAANADYIIFYNDLSSQNRQPNSKLDFPESPKWHVLVDEQRKIAILFFTASDLMYALEVNFVYSLDDATLQKVFVHEWFKGE